MFGAYQVDAFRQSPSWGFAPAPNPSRSNRPLLRDGQFTKVSYRVENFAQCCAAAVRALARGCAGPGKTLGLSTARPPDGSQSEKRRLGPEPDRQLYRLET